MMTVKRAIEIYNELADVISRRNSAGLYTAMGYSSNLDILLDFDVDTLNELLGRYVPDGVLEDMRPAALISSHRELLETIVYYCSNGIGGEADISDPDLIRNSFPCKNGMGGTAVQAALALERLGAQSVVHLSDDSEEVRSQLDYPCIRVPLSADTLGGAMDVRQRNPQEVHVILQFQKGGVIRLGSGEVTIPVSNRLILTKNTVNVTLPLDENYLGWIEKHAECVSSNVLSSFNCILDPDVLRERLERVKSHVDAYRAANPDGIVYFEDAHYHDKTVRRLCIETLYPHVDIMSMNEEELKYTLDMFGKPVDIDDILSCVEGVDYLRKTCGIRKGVIVHTKDYAMYSGDRTGLDIERGMVYGALLATAKAAFGSYGSDEQIRSILDGELSGRGISAMETASSHGLDERVCVVPTFYLDKPKYTIGLGDSFTGGVQLCFNSCLHHK